MTNNIKEQFDSLIVNSSYRDYGVETEARSLLSGELQYLYRYDHGERVIYTSNKEGVFETKYTLRGVVKKSMFKNGIVEIKKTSYHNSKAWVKHMLLNVKCIAKRALFIQGK